MSSGRRARRATLCSPRSRYSSLVSPNEIRARASHLEAAILRVARDANDVSSGLTELITSARASLTFGRKQASESISRARARLLFINVPARYASSNPLSYPLRRNHWLSSPVTKRTTEPGSGFKVLDARTFPQRGPHLRSRANARASARRARLPRETAQWPSSSARLRRLFFRSSRAVGA